MAEPKARIIDGKKFMWDGREYESRAEADGARKEYEKESFETRIVEEDEKLEIYTRRVASEVVVEGSPPV
ncbi:MAG: hypothetical protein GY769_06055 [bacterium]|nr:hypothetical protein [bacterium]